MRGPSHNTTTYIRTANRSWTMSAVILAVFCLVPVVVSAQLINPTAPPPAGQSAVPLTTSNVAQWKSGSLIIGNSSIVDTKLCLNAPDSVTDPASYNNPSYCIHSWNDLVGVVAGSYVSLHTETITGPPGQLTSYAAPQRGFIRLRGDLNSYGATIRSEANSALGGSTALYADGLEFYNYAGYFVGTFAVEPTATSSGSLCLNSTTNDGQGHYCISQWSDIAPGVVSNKLTLQQPALNARPTVEQGDVFLQQAFNAASFTIGDPIDLPVALKCGDGICTNYGPFPETSANCALDCATITTATTFTATAASGAVNLVIQTGQVSNAPFGNDPNVYLLVVRSTDPNLNFQPVNGQSYAPGTANGLTILIAQSRPSNSFYNYTDGGLTGGTTYYYRVYQGNKYPRYTPSSGNPGYLSASATPTGSGGGGGGGGGGGDEGPIIPKQVL